MTKRLYMVRNQFKAIFHKSLISGIYVKGLWDEDGEHIESFMGKCLPLFYSPVTGMFYVKHDKVCYRLSVHVAYMYNWLGGSNYSTIVCNGRALENKRLKLVPFAACWSFFASAKASGMTK